jgi:short-subunit dehydrogenase
MKVYTNALITGASSGIGEAFARRLAAGGTNLALVARSEDKLHLLAGELSEKHRIRAEVIAADLSAPGAAQAVWEEAARRGLSVDLLINNAGFGTYGTFDSLPRARETEEISLNVTALVELTHLFLPAMLAQHSGAVINVASTAAFQPVPYMAVYGATKAFVLSFSEALWAEYKPHGLRVLAFCPGPVDTAFAETAGTPLAGHGPAAESVVQIALQALSRGRSYVIPGGGNYRQSWGSRLLPRAAIAQISERMMRPRAS